MTDGVYVEREARPEEEDRGKVLDALAGPDALWCFLKITFPAPGEIALGMEVHDGLDAGSLRALLQRTLDLMPAGD